MSDIVLRQKWDAKPKVEARLKTIIEPYKSIFKRPLLPNEQYWTFAGGIKGNNLDNYEVGQIINSGLVKPYQFHGVDIDEYEIDNNKKTCKNTPFSNCNWHHGTLSKIIRGYVNNNNFNPAIINIDHHKMYERAILDFITIISLVNCLDKNGIMVVFNFAVETRHHKLTNIEIIRNFLSRQPEYNKFIQKFKLYGAYDYNGTGKGKKRFLSLMWNKI